MSSHLQRPQIGGRKPGLSANNQVRSNCKRDCGSPLLHGQPSVWLSGPAIGLAHADCDQPDGPSEEVRRGR